MNYIVTKSPKSYGIAILLILLFGPIGLFYSTVLGGIIMTFIVPLFIATLVLTGTIPLAAIGIFIVAICVFYYLILFVWCITGIASYNKKILENSYKLDYLQSNENNDHSDKYFSKPRNSSSIWPYILILCLLIAIACIWISKN